MSPWVDDPETRTSVYERPKKRKLKPAKGSLAELAAQHNAEVAAQLAETARTLGDAEGPMESFGQKMARLKREKKAAAEYPGEPGDGKDPL